MFDLGFVEMLVIGLILLLVVGPERLPEVARTVGGWVHQAKQYFDSMKNQLDRETRFSELQSQLKGEDGASGARKGGSGGSAQEGENATSPEAEAGEESSEGKAAGETAAEGQEGPPPGPDVSGRSAAEGEAADSLEQELGSDESERGRQDRGG